MSERIAKLKDMHEADPTDAFCTYALAMELEKQGEREQAIDWLERTIEIDRQQAYAWYHKGRLLAELGRTSEAGEALTAGLEAAKRSGDGKAGEELAALLESLGPE